MIERLRCHTCLAENFARFFRFLSGNGKEQAFNQLQKGLSRYVKKNSLAQLLALAMIRVQQRATAAGKPDEARKIREEHTKAVAERLTKKEASLRARLSR